MEFARVHSTNKRLESLINEFQAKVRSFKTEMELSEDRLTPFRRHKTCIILLWPTSDDFNRQKGSSWL